MSSSMLHLPLANAWLLMLWVAGSLLRVEGKLSLFHALKLANATEIQALIDAGVGINDTNSRGQTALHIAALHGNTSIVQSLTNSHVLVDLPDKRGETALQLAVQRGHLETVQVLITAQADVNKLDSNGLTPLQVAASNGCTSIVKALIEGRAHVDVQNQEGETALHLAVLGGHSETVEALIQARAQLDARDKEGRTPLLVAVSAWKPDMTSVVQALIRAGATTDIRGKHDETPLEVATESGQLGAAQALIQAGAQQTMKDKDWALFDVADSGDAKMVKELVHSGAYVNFQNSVGETALHKAALGGHVDVVKALLEMGAHPNIQDDQGKTALHEAATSGSPDIVKDLIHHGVDVNIQDSAGQTAMHIAASKGDATSVEALIHAKAHIELRDAKGETALHKAANSRDTETVKALIDANAKLDVRNAQGQTPLHIAASGGATSVEKVLLSAGAQFELKDDEGQSALHEAAKSGNPDALEVLLLAGASEDDLDKHGRTPGFIAAERGDSAAVLALLNSSDKTSENSSRTWMQLRDDAGRLPWDVTADEDILEVLPEPSYWQRWGRALQTREFLLAICGGLASSLPLAALQISLRRSGQGGDKLLKEPSPGAQQLAVEAAFSPSSPTILVRFCRFFEVWVATGVLAWSLGYLLRPWLSFVLFLMVYIFPTTLFIGFGTLVRNPFLCFLSCNGNAILDPLSTLSTSFSLAFLRCALILFIPSILVLFLDSGSESSIHHLSLTFFNSNLEGPSVNLHKVSHDHSDVYCLLNPGIEHVFSQLRRCSLHFELFHLLLPLVLVLLAALLPSLCCCCCCCCCCSSSGTSKGRISQVAEEASSGVDDSEAVAAYIREKLRIGRKLAMELDAVMQEALPDDQAVWKTTGRVLERSGKVSSNLAEPASCGRFWRSPNFEIGLMGLDIFSDLFTLQNLFVQGCWWSGGALLACLTSSIFAELVSGNTPAALVAEARESTRLGIRTKRFIEMLQHQAAWEALPSLIVNAYAFWFAVNQSYQFVLCLLSVFLSMFSVAKLLHQTVDLMLSENIETEEEQELLAFANREC